MWDFKDNTVSRAFVTVIVEQLEAEPARLHADCRVSLWIEVFRTAEDFGRDLVFLGRGSGLRQLMLGQIAKQFTKRFGFAERVAMDELFNLIEVALFINDLDRRNRHVTLQPRPLYLLAVKRHLLFRDV